MKLDIKVPAVGESITEATIGSWLKKSGDFVNANDVLLALETDKASVEVIAEKSGRLQTSANEGDVVKIGSVVGSIDTDAKSEGKEPAAEVKAQLAPVAKTSPVDSGAPLSMATGGNGGLANFQRVEMPLSPAVRKMVTENNVDPTAIPGSGKGGRLTKGDVIDSLGRGNTPQTGAQPTAKNAPSTPFTISARASTGQLEERREPMTQLRKTIAKRLVEAQRTAAILTTFNEIDMTAAMALRKKYGEKFEKTHGLKLGFMGLFSKAVIEALRAFPRVNGSIDGDDVIYRNYVNLGIAVSTERGLLVPVIRSADQMTLADIEKSIANYAMKARENKISVDDLSGGTFTISNGGVFGSLMSTPILNPPQSGILGLHKIQDRPVVIDGQVVARPMMYVALSYDHRIIDGKESVSFLVRIKECMEDPSRILLEM